VVRIGVGSLEAVGRRYALLTCGFKSRHPNPDHSIRDTINKPKGNTMINMTNDELRIPVLGLMREEVLNIRKALDRNQIVLTGERPLSNAARARKAAFALQIQAYKAANKNNPNNPKRERKQQ
jgi:hypothetical protein